MGTNFSVTLSRKGDRERLALSGGLSQDRLHRPTVESFDAFENADVRSHLSGLAGKSGAALPARLFQFFAHKKVALNDQIATYADDHLCRAIVNRGRSNDAV